MPAKTFLGAIEEKAQRFYATMLRGEVSDANVQGYLRAASQIEDVWQQVDDRITTLIAGGAAPWDAYAQMRYALAFIRAARTYQVFVRELLAADYAADPATKGYLPHITYDQADALCHQIQPCLQRAITALNEPEYTPDMPLPLPLEPHLEAEGGPCPTTHLLGTIAAAREVREWAAGLIAQYENAITEAKAPAPAAITTHLTALHSKLAQADSQLRFGTDLVGQVTEGQTTPELHEQAEQSLWDGLRGFFLLNQIVAIPDPQSDAAMTSNAHSANVAGQRQRRVYRDKRIRPADLWRVAAPSAQAELRGTEFGADELKEMCEKMGGILSAGAQQYLDEADAAVQRGDASIIAAMANCPFEPLYRARKDLDIAGAHIPSGHEFHWNFHRGHIETAPRFTRVGDWQECEE